MWTTARTKYSDHIDYVVGAIIYLGTFTYWWARTAKFMARELHLDEQRLQTALDIFPGIFRRVEKKDLQAYYSLQARYAQYISKEGEDPDPDSDIPPVDTDRLKLVIEFVQKMAELERTDARTWWAQFGSIAAVIISAIAVIVAATIKVNG
jgi:hypothetical protein